METYPYAQRTTETSADVDLVIEDLDEFACGYSLSCICSTAADYVVRMPAPAAGGRRLP
jgi:hypothetical protein